MTGKVAPRFDHLFEMTDDRGTFEHARYSEPRRGLGYCTDDMARVLVVATREPVPAPAVRDLARTSLRFLVDAQGADGSYRNRLSRRGRWEDRPALEDCWGRSIWGLGTAASCSEDRWLCEVATAELDYINSVFAHNVAKLSLARAVGGASANLEQFLKLP